MILMKSLCYVPRRAISKTHSCSPRCFSLITPEEFSNRKSEYDKKVTSLRKQWTADYKEQQELAMEKKRKETQRVILQKAIRLRTKREDSAARNALKKYNNERAEYFYKEHLAKLNIIRSKKAVIQKKRFDSLVQSLEAESKYWVTPENMDSKITEELFNKPCTTGVVTKSSEFWRNYARCTNINRLLFGVLPHMKDEDTINDVILERTQAERATKEDIMGTLNSMIGTGEDREKFDELVEDFSTFTGSLGGTSRKPVNYNVKPDLEKMKKSDLINMFEKGENEYEDKLLHEKIDAFMEGNSHVTDEALTNDGDSDIEDLHISENDYHLDDEQPHSTLMQNNTASKSNGEEFEVEDNLYFEDEDSHYASAEPSMLDDLIEDLEYMDENDEEALFNTYEKMKLKMNMMSKHRI